MSEPISVIPLQYAEPAAVPSPAWRAIVRVCHPLALLVGAVAWLLLAFVRVESVVFTGALLFILGVLLVIGGAFTRNRGTIGFGVGHTAICMLFFALVNLGDWSPNQAKGPFMVVGGLYLAVVGSLAGAPFPRASANGSAGPERT